MTELTLTTIFEEAVLSVENWLLTGHALPLRVTAIFAGWFILLCTSAFVKNARYHAAIAILFALLFLLFIIFFGLRLGGT